ncbi:MAG: hypothetical protein ISS18_12665 [Bacteroidales bacterium]|nr:hypothetical protein [Bacteroidales bacterium]
MKTTLKSLIDKQSSEIKELQSRLYEPIYSFDLASAIAHENYVELDQAIFRKELKVIHIGAVKMIRRKDLLEWMENKKKAGLEKPA